MVLTGKKLFKMSLPALRQLAQEIVIPRVFLSIADSDDRSLVIRALLQAAVK